ncbi:hypothetical protein LINPERPRIM_LOCUS3835 [Linum perenne]
MSFPDGYASNIARCVDLPNCKMFGLKSHDSHMLLHDLLPLAIRNVLPVTVARLLVELGACFKELCSLVVNIVELDKLQGRFVIALWGRLV